MPDGCEVHVLAGPADDAPAALAALADASARAAEPRRRQPLAPPELPTGPLTAEAVCAALGALLPEGAIVSDEGNTSGLFAAGVTAGAPPPRLARASPAARSARACRSRSAPRSRAPTAR